jgi:SAM-dependent methyltransferase
MATKVSDIPWELTKPLLMICISSAYIPKTIYKLLVSGSFGTLLSPSAFRWAWFANFWAGVGPKLELDAAKHAAPLVAEARGVVLDIGPGGGGWLKHFDKTKVKKIYGVEPSPDHHEKLMQNIKENGLEDIYVLVPVGVEDLGEKWVKMGEVDTVVTIQCLCSVDEPQKMIRELYGYLKDGGCWIAYEHVKTFPHQGATIKFYQGEY